MTRYAYILAGLLCIVVFFACKKDQRDPCLQPRTTVLRAHAYHHADTGNAIRDTLLPYPVLKPVTGGTTQYYFTGGARLSTLSFTLSNLYDSSVWIVRPDSAAGAAQDTLTFYYERQLRFLSNACGYTYFYNLQRVSATAHALDSALIAQPDITSDVNVTHLKLYY